MTLRVGLTGGIGSGKSTVANFFEHLGATIIDADVIAHQITQKDQTCTKKIIEHFGHTIENQDGSLNRQALRKFVFQNESERIWLEKLLHPIIINQIKLQIKKATSPYCIIVIPLLVESNSQHWLDRICVIDIAENIQIERAKSRDKTTEEMITAIIKSQSEREQRLAIADDVIHNDKDLDALQQQVTTLHQHYLALAQQ